MPKDIYKTFKRSISAVTGVGTSSSSNNGESSSTPSTSNVKYRGGSGRTWIHPPDFLINGRVEYVARFLGTVETAKAHGSDVAREAIHAIRFQRDLKRSEQTRETAKLQKVDIQISIDNVVIADTKSKQVLYTFPLGRISFCADDKDDKRMFSFIARAEGSGAKHSCFAFTSEKLAEEITLTIGEAFDLAYKRFLDKNRSSLENQKQVFILRKRIAELEAENQVLSERLAETIRSSRQHGSGGMMAEVPNSMAPALPRSPMPQAPPPNLPTNMMGSIYSTPKPEDLLSAPPLEIAPRLPPLPPITNGITASSTSSSTTSPTSTSTPPASSPNSSSGPAPTHPPPKVTLPPPPPPVAPRRPVAGLKQLEGVDFGNGAIATTPPVKDAIFDDEFDPRAGEQQQQTNRKSYDPFGDDFMPDKLTKTPSRAAVPAATTAPPKTAADYQAMIENVEKRLAEMSQSGMGEEFGQFETGELTGLAEAENEYGTPSDRLNAQVMNLKQ